jgi:quercetin dioxygenase-like cupin family protein
VTTRESASESSHARPVTSGSETRPPRPLRRPLVVDLAQEAASLFDEPEWQAGDRNSRTVATSDRLRITVTALRAGAELGSEESDDTLAVQVLRGRVELSVDGDNVELSEGRLAAIEEPRDWRLRAYDDALILLTVGLASRSSSR